MNYLKECLQRRLLQLLKQFHFESSLLEVGCGVGENLTVFRNHFEVEGIDLSARAVEICRTKGLNVKNMGFLEVTKKYKSIVCVDVIEHVKDDEQFVAHFKEVLDQSGKMMILVPSGKLRGDDNFYGHYRRYSKEQITALLSKHFEIKYVEMFGYPFFYYSRLLLNLNNRYKTMDSEKLHLNTLHSSYKNAFDHRMGVRVIGKLLEINILKKALLKTMSYQNNFKNGSKGLAVIVVCEPKL